MPAAAAQAAAPAPPVRIAPPDSAEERKADRIANAVAHGGSFTAAGGGQPDLRVIHRQCAACTAGGPPCADCDADEAAGTLLLKRTGAAPPAAQAAQAAASAVQGGGRPLPHATRDYFEPRFGSDLSSVRIHTDSSAGAAAAAINARAYALGEHIAFAPGQFASQTSRGRRLIAHELAHVIGGDTRNAVIRRDVFDEAQYRSLVESDLETLTTAELERLVDQLREAGFAAEPGSADFEGIRGNLALVESVLAERYSSETSPPARTPAQGPAPISSVESASPALEPNKPDFATGAYAAYRGLSLRYTDTHTNWSSQDERRQYQQSYLDYTREHDTSLYKAALQYLFEVGQSRAQQAQAVARRRAEAQHRRDLEILRNNRPGLLHILMPAHTRHTFRDRTHQIRDPYLRSMSRMNVEAVFAAARLGRDVTAVTAGVASALAILAVVGVVAVEAGAGAAIAAGTARVITLAGGELSLAAGALRAAGQSAWVFYLQNAIAVNEIGLFTVGTVISVEGDVVGMLEAIANDPVAGAQILFEVWVLRVNISVAGGPPRPYTVRARPMRASAQNNPRALRLQVIEDPVPASTAPARRPTGATAEGTGEGFTVVHHPDLPDAPVQQRQGGTGVVPEASASPRLSGQQRRPRQGTTRRDIADVLAESTEGTAGAVRSPAGPEELNLPNPRQAAEVETGGGFSPRIVWQPPPGAPPRPPQDAPLATRQRWLRQRLQMHVDEAIERYNVEGLTPQQAEAAARNARMTPAFRGSRIDQFAKDSVQQDPDLAQVITAPDFVSEPDLLHAAMPEWFDVTTRRAWAAHLVRYAERYGAKGILLPTD